MSEPRLHHYVPRFYLSGFADPGVLGTQKKEVIWVYERGKQPRRASPKSEARARDYYTYNIEGSRNTDIETWLADLERQVAPIITALSNDRRPITNSEKELLAYFVGTMQMRTPSGRHLYENRIDPFATEVMREAAMEPARFRRFLEDNDLLSLDNFDPEQVRQEILSGHDDILAAHPALNLVSIIEIGRMIAQVLLEMNWQTIYSEDQECFLTSDDPVATHAVNPKSGRLHLRMGVARTGVNVWFPLSRTVCLRILKDGESGHGRWTNAGIRSVNKLMIMTAHRWVYASQHSLKIKQLFDKRGGAFDVKKIELEFNGLMY